ncbi:CvpA family protein [Candidatus Aerophobetes bacterium]|nr:CvpA family protein [Candidatus Aerophobetes bacterium]
MNWVDIVFGAIILIFVIRGALRGLIREGAGLAGILIGFILGINRYQELGIVLYREIGFLSQNLCNIIAFIIIFIGIALIGAIVGILLHDLTSRRSIIRGLEEGGGFVLGLIEGVLVCSIIVVLLSALPFSDKFDRWSKNSFLKPYLLKAGPSIYDTFVSLTSGKAKKFMEKIDPFKLEDFFSESKR